MSKINSFQDLDCWKNARKLAVAIYQLKGEINKDYGLRDQLRRASISIMNNIAEGYGRFSNKEKIRYLEIAQSSTNEVQSMLFILEDLSYLELTETQHLRDLATTTQKQTWGLIKYLRNN
ncbi:four helix bundle protein [Lewinella cohaerens]|uniref:four helix bundle protein n=1 Tax=Lewinella cohaerens TaxID=70995 RepID=UPI00037B2A73|nr:four helix bundle protein [Lewinella cohaerens]